MLCPCYRVFALGSVAHSSRRQVHLADKADGLLGSGSRSLANMTVAIRAHVSNAGPTGRTHHREYHDVGKGPESLSRVDSKKRLNSLIRSLRLQA